MSEEILVEEGDLAALRESIVGVLSDLCSSQALHAHVDGKADLEPAIWRQASELGWLAVALPNCYGGLGLGALGLDVLHRELGRFLCPGPFVSTLALAQALAETADPAVNEVWLPRLATGEATAAVPVTIGSGGPSDLFLGTPDAQIGISLRNDRWVLLDLSECRGEKVDFWDGTRSVVRHDIAGVPILAELPVETGAALGDAIALAVASDSQGGVHAIANQTIEYMKTRHQFGRSVASFQALKHRAADIVMRATTGDHIVAQAVEMAARGDVDSSPWAALAKAAASDGYVAIAADCIQLHGGVGFTWEFDAHIFLKRAHFNQMLVSSSAQMRDRAAAGLAAAARAGRTTLELTEV